MPLSVEERAGMYRVRCEGCDRWNEVSTNVVLPTSWRCFFKNPDCKHKTTLTEADIPRRK